MSKPGRPLGDFRPWTGNPTSYDLGWAACLFECNWTELKERGLRMTVKNNYACSKLIHRFGGSMYENGSAGGYMWTLNGDRLIGFLFTIYSLLSSAKKQKIRDAMTFYYLRGAPHLSVDMKSPI